MVGCWFVEVWVGRVGRGVMVAANVVIMDG